MTETLQKAKPKAESPFEILTNKQKLQFAWDATSLSTFKTCPRKYYYAQILGLRSRQKAAPLEFGGLYHDMLEFYDRLLSKGVPFETAVRDTVRYGLKRTTTYSTKIVLDAETGGEVEIKTPIFWTTDQPQRTRETLIRSFIWFTEQFKVDPLKTFVLENGKPAIELTFRLELPITTPGGRPYLWCGHMDKVSTVQDHVYVHERKHTVTTLSPSYFDKYSPNTQVTGYIFGASIVLGKRIQGAFVDAAQIAVNFTRFGRSIVNRTKGQIEEWYQGTLHWIKLAEQAAQENHYPMNEESCSNFGGCAFRNVCSKDASVRKLYLDQDFELRAWNPLEDREV
jgi:hypothetical protein